MSAAQDKEQTKKQNIEPILLIDKKGVLGLSLLVKLQENGEIPVVFVSGVDYNDKQWKHVLVVPYKKKFPVIPKAYYSHILYIAQGKEEESSLLKEFLEEAREVSQLVTIVFPFSSYHRLFPHITSSSHRKVQLALIGDIFDEKNEEQNVITNILNQAKAGTIVLSNMGLHRVFPIHKDDVITILEKILIRQKATGALFYLFPKHPMTALSFVRLIQKADPDIHLDFAKEQKEESEEKFSIEKEGVYLEKDLTILEKRVKQVMESFPKQQQKELEGSFFATPPMSLPTSSNKQHLIKTLCFSVFLTSIFIFVLPIVITLGTLYIGMEQLENAKSALEKGNTKAAQQSFNASSQAFSQAEKSFTVLSSLAKIVGQEHRFLGIEKDLKAGKELTVLASSIVDLFGEKSFGIGEEKISTAIKSGILTTQKLQTEQKSTLTSYINKESQSLLQKISSFAESIPYVFGNKEKQAYLVLFQNNMELRPGGGFIGSYGLLSIKGGEISDFTVHDVYDADGQLKGHIEPPFAFRRYFPLVHWYLRDSNFSADFPKNASTAAYFLNQETGENITGVIAVDVSFLKLLLEATGPIYIPEYNETVSSDTVYLVTQTNAEKDFFPGSTQKKDFLRALYKALNRRFIEKKDVSYVKLFTVIEKALKEKHLLLASSDASVQTLLNIEGLSASLWDKRISQQNTINDFLGISEANIGANKANYFLKRSIQHNIVISEKGSILETLTVTYQNKSKVNEWPGGDYKNYFRIVIPKNAVISKIAIDRKDQPFVKAVINPKVYESKNFRPPKELEVEETEELDKKVVGFLTIIPTGATKVIEVSYVLPQKITPTQAFTYDILVMKQPGTQDDPYTFAMSYPQTHSVVSNSLALSKQNGRLTMEQNLIKDITASVRFLPKEK